MNNINFHNKKIDRQPVRVEFDDEQYPSRVKKILGEKAPKHLDMVGNTKLLNMSGLSFCGSRQSSAKGLETARDCVMQAVENNFSVISGNAKGVDLEAHFNCLQAGGNTIFVLPEGINHFRIKKELKSVWDWNRVLVISQFEPDAPWKVFQAMKRNQLVIALSRVMIVIEAGEKGGTLEAGKEALNSKIPLYVTQYKDMPVNARGNQFLLDRGAVGLGKNRTTNKANLTKVFEDMKEDTFLKNLTKQSNLF